ncbi:hypothetical protein PVL29_027334 [Vitis rotundifolia]|uniref:ADP-ribosyl cyclase/cyclic ADP-ribose hydrolase n=1 Tax=Vitis rotundifolia TaxID=103349 RepID=A0AA38YIW5_VITRO|nr:hypothetical protein PVL29_027334 [Vitis rotundifolia]
MTSTNTQIISYSPPPSSSSSSKSTHQFPYEVFLSFRGEDARYGFTDHLYEALISHGIRTFRDDEELVRGRVIASELLNAIEESKIFVFIFSKNYATSRWCLDELVKIFGCMATKQRLILPIFYHVDPSEVRKESGCYEEAFRHHEKEADVEKKKIQKWRIALTAAGNLAGYDLKNYGLIKEIIDVILKELNSKFLLHGSENMVGVNVHFEKLKSLIKIGIYGLLRNWETNLEINNILEGINVIKWRLRSKKVLLILDDVDKLEQLKFLVGEHGWFGPKSRIIITTRDQQLLRVHKVDVSYEVKELDYEELIQLFYYVSVSNDVVRYVNGLPLAIEILGSSLFSKSKDEWENTLQKLKKIPNMQVQNVLMTSFDGLDKIEKGIFLDVACFFKGCRKNDVTRLLDYATGVLRVLSDKCLITLSDNIIRMHDLVQEMGREIVRHDHPQKPWKWSSCRILRQKKGSKAIEGIFLDMSRSREISFTTKAFERMERLRLLKVYWSCDVNVNDMGKEYQKLILPEDIEFLSYDLRYLHWEGYSLKSLPSNFEGHNLIELNLEHSNIKYLSQGEKIILLFIYIMSFLCIINFRLQNLKVLNLSGSQRLTDMPHFSNMSNLVKLNIAFCESLDKVDSSIGSLKKLTSLNLSGCRKIRSLPSTIQHLISLEYLNLSDCSNLETFPEISEYMECLKGLYLSRTCIKDLPSSIEFLNHLIFLKLEGCENLRSLLSSICRLKSLGHLWLGNYTNLETFPEIMDDMKCLENLYLDGTGIKELLSSIGYLKHLSYLSLRQCKNLSCLPSSIGRLKYLEYLVLDGCPNLVTEDMENLTKLGLSETQNLVDGVTLSDLWCLSSLVVLNLSQNNMRHIPAAITQLCNLDYLNISHCKMLEEIPELPSSLREIDAHDCLSLGTLSNPSTLLWSSLLKWLWKVQSPSQWKQIILGSHGIPGWVLHQEMGRQIRIEFPMNWYEDDQFLGFAFFFLHPGRSSFRLSLKSDNEDKLSLVYHPKTIFRDKFHSNQYMHLKASFVSSNFGSQNKTKSFGVHLIYSQDHQQNHNSLLDFPENSGDNKSTAKDIKRSHDDATHNQAEEPYHKRLRESNTHLKP